MTAKNIQLLLNVGIRVYSNYVEFANFINVFKLEEKEFEKILFFISERLDNRYYWHVFDPSNQVDTEPVCGDLLDDLGDIYKDLKRSILIFKPPRWCRIRVRWCSQAPAAGRRSWRPT